MVSDEQLYAAYSPDASNNTNVHVTNISQSNSQDILMDDLVEVHQNISIQRKRARDGLVVQSERMVQRSRLQQVEFNGRISFNLNLFRNEIRTALGNPKTFEGSILN